MIRVNYSIIGVAGTSLKFKQYFDLAVKGYSKPLTSGELGCTLSHLEALTAFLQTNDQYALILEDDALIPENLSFEKLHSEIQNYKLPENILFSLGGIQMKECLKVRG